MKRGDWVRVKLVARPLMPKELQGVAFRLSSQDEHGQWMGQDNTGRWWCQWLGEELERAT